MRVFMGSTDIYRKKMFMILLFGLKKGPAPTVKSFGSEWVKFRIQVGKSSWSVREKFRLRVGKASDPSGKSSGSGTLRKNARIRTSSPSRWGGVPPVAGPGCAGPPTGWSCSCGSQSTPARSAPLASPSRRAADLQYSSLSSGSLSLCQSWIVGPDPEPDPIS